MNKGYTQIGDKVIISDENGVHTQSEYYDNLDKVLVQENIIEEMENRIQELTKESEEYPVIKKKYIPAYLYSGLVGGIIGTGLLNWILTGTNPYSLNYDTVYGTFNYGLYLSMVGGIPTFGLGSILSLIDYSNYKNKVKKGNGINSELEFLKLQIEKEKETLVSLQKDKTKVNETVEYISKQVDDKQQLEALRNYLELYYDLGSNKEKYYRYYQQGKLDKKMQRHYNDEDIELAKEYLDKKGPTLVRKSK